MNLTRQSTSKEPIKTRIVVEENGVMQDPTADTVQWAFTESDDLSSASWLTGSWETQTGSTGETEYWAAYLLPGTMAKGSYVVHVKVTDSPAVPVLRVGILKLV